MRSLELTAALSIVLVFAASGVLKMMRPKAAEALVNDFGLPRSWTRLTVSFVAAAELVAAVGMLFDQGWAYVLAAALVVVFSISIAWILRRGAKPRCGCLGDLSVARAGSFHLARNVALIGAICLAALGPADRPFDAVPPAIALSFLLLAVPESLEVLLEFRESVRREVREVMERGAGLYEPV